MRVSEYVGTRLNKRTRLFNYITTSECITAMLLELSYLVVLVVVVLLDEDIVSLQGFV